MLIKVSRGKKINVAKSKFINSIREGLSSEFKVKPDEIIDIEGIDDVIKVNIGKIEIVEINEEELLQKSIKQILKEKKISTRNATIEVVKEKVK